MKTLAELKILLRNIFKVRLKYNGFQAHYLLISFGDYTSVREFISRSNM